MYATEVHVHVVRINNCTIMYKLNEPYPPPPFQQLDSPFNLTCSKRNSEASIFPLFYFKMKVMFETQAY